MRISEVILQQKVSIRKRFTLAQDLLVALIIIVGSTLFASTSNAQAHDHSAMPTADSADADAYEETAADDEHAQHAPAADPHAGHVMVEDTHADAAGADNHSQHAPASDPHAGHPIDANSQEELADAGGADDHSQHAPAPDPHAGHVMDANVQGDVYSHAQPVETAAHDHSAMANGMDMGSSAQAARRDPHAYSNGLEVGEGPYALDNYRLHLMDETRFGAFWMNRMEQLFRDGADGIEYDAQAWYGTSYDRIVLKAEGEVQDGALEESNTEILWTHAVRSFWNTQIGVLNQTGDGPDRNWLALGLQGTAPYWFEVDATVYLGESGRSSFNLEAEYELWLTQRLILQPRMEMNFYGKDDQATAIGSGLSDLSTGIRLQYQISRQFVPYAGVEQIRQYGQTARYSGRSSGDSETRWLAGLRFWF